VPRFSINLELIHFHNAIEECFCKLRQMSTCHECLQDRNPRYYCLAKLQQLDETPRVAAENISEDVCGKKILIVDDNVGVV
jgi:hypothetical protein